MKPLVLILSAALLIPSFAHAREESFYRGHSPKPTPTPTPTSSALTPSISGAVAQNSGINLGLYPAGVPSDFSWYAGGAASPGYILDPSGFTSLTAWGEVFAVAGDPVPSCNIYVQGFQLYAHLVSGGWVKLQDQDSGGIGGAQFLGDDSTNDTINLTIAEQSDGSYKMASPGSGYNDQFWPDAGRPSYSSSTINGVFVLAMMKVDSSSAKLIANLGADWWLSPTAGYAAGGVNNPGIGESSWVQLSTNYQYLYYTNLTEKELQADPPPLASGE